MAAACGATAPTVSVSIMARPGRSSEADALTGQLAGASVRIVTAADSDGQPGGSNRLAKRVWQPWLRRATHHLVLQDDVILHPHFLRQVVDAVTSQPASALSFFSEWGSYTSHALRVAAFAGRAWVTQPDNYLSTIAMVLPVDAAAAFADAIDPDSSVPDDEAAFAFVRGRGLSHFVSNPNLVQLPHVESDSKATCFLPDAPAPASWWRSEPLTTLREIPAIDWREGEPVSFEVPRAGAAGEVRPRRESLGPHARRLTRIARDRLLCTEVAGRDLRATAALLGAATVLCDQIDLAAHLDVAPSEFGEACARESAATLAAGSLRQRVPALADAGGAAEIRAAFLAIYDDVRDILEGLA